MSALQDTVDASLTLNLKAKSGYRCKAEYKISARQWCAIVRLCDKYALENERLSHRQQGEG